jgi:cyclase
MRGFPAKCGSVFKTLAMAAAVATAAAGFAQAQGGAGIDYAHTEIKTTKLADNLYVFVAGPGLGNVVILTGPDGVLMIDAMYPQMHDKLMGAIRAITPGPIRYVINTHLHGDHTGGNGLMVKEGATVIAQDNVRKRMELIKPVGLPADPKNDTVTQGQMRARAAEGKPAYPPQDVPTITYSDTMTLRFDGEDIYIFHPAPAHTDGDSIVYFRHANVMHVGDLPASLRFNNIGVDDGGSIDGMIADGKLVMRVANPRTKIVAGHLGPVVGFKEIQEQEVMFQTVRDRVAKMIREGKSEDEIIASKPTKEFDMGRMGGTYTPDRWVALVYTDLSRRLKK